MRSLIYFLLIPLSILFGQGINDWETHTYMNDVKDILYYEDYIWAATTGGAYKFNVSDSTFQKFTNIDGLNSINLSAIEKDSYGNIIVGSADGKISMINHLNSCFAPLKDFSEFNIGNISDIFFNNDTLWFAADAGVGVFLYINNNYEFRDFFDDLPIIPEKSTKIVIFNNKIFYATKNGLLCAPPNFIKSPDNWEVYNTTNLLPDNDIRTLAIIKDTLYIGTAKGAVRLSKDGWNDNANNWNNGIVRHIISVNDTLHFFRQGDYYIFNGNSWERIKSYGIVVNSVIKDNTENLWLAFDDSGLLNWEWNAPFKVDGPGSNHIGIVKRTSDGNLWMTNGKIKLYYNEGFFNFNFQNWTNYKFSNGLWAKKNNTVTVFEDFDNTIWIGTWNGGIFTLSDAGYSYIHNWADSGIISISNNLETKLIDLPGLPANRTNCLSQSRQSNDNLLVAPCFIEDGDGNLFLANYIADDLNFITIIPRKASGLQFDDCSNWIHFGSNIGMSFNEGKIASILFDDYGRLWVGTYENKLLVIDFNETLENPNDDVVYRFDRDDGLYSNTILCMSKDHDGVIWIGTNAGLNSYDGQNFYKHIGKQGPVENKINYIFVDDYNNKWFATEGGLSILEGDKSPWEEPAWSHFTQENSGLANNIVNSVFVDSKKGEAYIGTQSGLSVFRGAFAEIKNNYDFLKGGPNPFFTGDSRYVFTIKNLAINSTVKILNINGKLVRTLTEERNTVIGGRAHWDGRDEENNFVASGIYIYIVYDEDGATGSGKISVIRK